MLVRREAAAEVGYLDPDFFVYSDECDFAKRLATPAGASLYVPAAGRSTTSSSPPTRGRLPRIVEFHRGRDLYMRKHHAAAAALACRVLTAWSYALRALAAIVLPDQPARATGSTPARRSSPAAARACAGSRRGLRAEFVADAGDRPIDP